MPKPSNYVTILADCIRRELPGMDEGRVQLYTLLALVRGRSTTMEDAHNVWAVWRNSDQPEHESLVPFYQLSREVQEHDRKYADGIRRAVEEYNAILAGGRP